MAIHPLLSVFFAWFLISHAQIISANGLTFDSDDVVSLAWSYESKGTARYDLYLCAGDETTDSYDCLAQVVQEGTFAPGDWVSFRVNQSVGGNEPNAYFLKIVSTGPNDSWSGYTYHFTLTNMKGSFPPQISHAIRSMTPALALPLTLGEEDRLLEEGPNPTPTSKQSAPMGNTESVLQFPAPIENEIHGNELRKRQDLGMHTVPFGMQTGPTKYAPMPKRAGSTILDKSPTPQYPPFPFVIATTYLGEPTVQTTLSEYLSATVAATENNVAPAAAPTLDKRMQQWLERWKD
ncbi:hypothetical protein N7474_007053 [Penicillium riverlandense]|uniref:uncharacterized protein n=1 Tax=Penicillium riverlandense TaxID=1903569 RepID=UPI002549A95F|nr:uncharacterized protein N7474_007053 [Penicillium riverlandense]KAJ5815276.1 hypothetical protein N7474_007053 [Penicillium riverlandense]